MTAMAMLATPSKKQEMFVALFGTQAPLPCAVAILVRTMEAVKEMTSTIKDTISLTVSDGNFWVGIGKDGRIGT